MPDVKGRLTVQELAFIEKYVETHDKKMAAIAAGYKRPADLANQVLARPAVQQEIARRQQELLFTDILPLAIKAHRELLTGKDVPAGARAQAVKLAYDRTLGDGQGPANQKEPHEMTENEIAEAIAEATARLQQIERVAADRARLINPPAGAADPSVFD